MSEKLICLVSFVLVLGLATASPAGLDDDPNLAGWWKFDGDTLDSSPNGRQGTLVGDGRCEARFTCPAWRSSGA